MKPKILIVDDKPQNLYTLEKLLQKVDVEVMQTTSPFEALGLATEHEFCLAIVDVQMPEMDGYELVELMRGNQETANLPVIFVSAIYSGEFHHHKGYEAGAVDFLSKPFNPDILLSKVRVFLQLYQQRLQLQELVKLEQKRRQLSDTLREVAKIVSSSLDRDVVLDLILTQLEQVVTYHRASISLLAGDQLTLIGGRNNLGKIVQSFSMPVDQYPLNKFTLQAKEPMLVPDVTQSEHWQITNTNDPTRSFINAPLLVHDQPIGLLGVGRSDETAYTEEDAQTVFAFATHVAIALENAHLMEQEQRQRLVSESLRQIASTLNSLLDRDKVLDKIMEELGHVIHYDGASIFLQEESDIVISRAVGFGSRYLGHRASVMDDNSVSMVFRDKSPMVIANVVEDSRWQVWEGGDPIRSWMGTPLLMGNEAIGVLTVDSFTKGAYSKEDCQTLQVFADQAATAIENARLYTMAQQELHERKRAEESLQKANEELAKLNADKDKFFSIVAHDLKGPFLPLLGNLELLTEMALNLSAYEVREMSAASHRSAKRVLGLLENLLHWSRIQMGRLEYMPTYLDLYDIAERNIKLLTANAQAKNINLYNQVTISSTLYADKDMVDMVIRNLTNNAIKFTPQGGQITISAQPNKAYMEISVIDTGIGISQEDIKKLFRIDVHHTTSGTAKEEGTGLGLVMCQEMVLLNGGKIWVESELGKGTAVKFTIPRQAE